jgi:hypothetical protein
VKNERLVQCTEAGTEGLNIKEISEVGSTNTLM